MPQRPKIPGQIQISNVPLQSRRSAFGGVYAEEDANITVRIEGDTSGVFQVTEVETDVGRYVETRHEGLAPLPALHRITCSGVGMSAVVAAALIA